MTANKPPGNQPPEAGGLNLGEIYYVLFRHKWLIVLFSLGGFAAAVALYFLLPRLYQSDTRLLVRYVVENRATEAPGSGEQTRSPDVQGDSILNSEIAILTSFDLLRQVVEAIGPEKILPPGSSEPDATNAAAGFISKSLTAAVANRSSVIEVVMQHSDPRIAREVLQALVEAYLKRHVEVHREAGTLGNSLTQQRDKSRADLTRTEEELQNLKHKVGVASVEDSRRNLFDQISEIQRQLLTCEADLAERQAAVNDSRVEVGSVPATNEVVVRQEIPPAKFEEYRRLVAQLEGFRHREQELLTQYSEGNLMVKKTRQLVEEALKTKSQMEEELPALRQVSVPSAVSPVGTVDPATDAVRLSALLARVKVLRNQLAEKQTNLLAIEMVGPEIGRLQARRDQEEAILRGCQARLDRVLANATGGAGNIAVVQEASPARRAVSKRLKIIGMALAAGIGGGIGLAFLIELMVRQSIRHSSQVEKKLGLPLFLSIPRLARNGSSRSAKSPRGTQPVRQERHSAAATLPNGESTPSSAMVGKAASPGCGGLAVAEWDSSHQMRSHHEALRDRLITYFEVRNMTHKPKLVAVTSCSPGAGVSSVAAGLAASLSETGDGNVLLVDMNLEHGAAHPFFRGKPAIGLAEAFDAEDRQPAQVQDNLYVVSASVTNGSLAQALPKRFSSLLPSFKASDYDYIIFDMPPVTQTSLTPRLSSYMDMVLLVLEAEKTNLGIAGKAAELLRESRASVGAVLNRKRKYVPSWLLEEF